MVTFYFCGTCSGKRGGFQSAFEEEIRRVMVHGVLHYADTRTREKEELLMRSKEDEVVPRGTVKVIFV
jgi:ssRNA-specific RNase YbeY (16S rRNA maturation enzyme)